MITLHALRDGISRAKARVQGIVDPRHRAFHAQRKVIGPLAREREAASIARGLPRTGVHQPHALATLTREGLLRLDPLLGVSEIASVRAHFADRLAHDPKRRHLGRYTAPGGAPEDCRRAEYDQRDVIAAPHLLRAANDPALLRLVEGYLGAAPVIAALRVWWTLPAGGTHAEDSELFHRDVDDYRFLKLFVYLTDVDAGSGPHVFATGSHRLDALTEIRRYRDEEVAGAVGSEALVQLIGPASTTFVEATYGLHRASRPVTRARLMFQALYTLRPTIYGPARPLRARSAEEQDLSPYVNQMYLRA